jgi:UrcA family protein
MIRTLLTIAAIAAATGTARAQEWRSTGVQIADLDLSTRAGVDELDRRVDRAVRRICDDDRDCRADAWASTVEQVDAAIARDRWMRRLAAEREAELRACGWQGCGAQAPVYYPAPSPYPAGTTVITVTVTQAPPPQVYYWQR